MASCFKNYFRLLPLLAGLTGTFSCDIYAMNDQKKNEEIDHPQIDFDPYNDRFLNQFSSIGRESKGLQRLREADLLRKMKRGLEKEREANPSEKDYYDKLLSGLNKDLQSIIAEQNSIDAKIGRVVASGIAGVNLNENVENTWDGVKLGTYALASKKVSEVVGGRIKDGVERVLGGTWDFFMSNIIEGWHLIGQDLFHNSKAPFTIDELRGWHAHLKSCFEDIAKLVKDGLKDSLRGHDMTARQDDGQNGEDEINAIWNIVIRGYVRQFDYCVTMIEKRIGYYDPEEMSVFYGTEIKQLVLEFRKELMKCTSVKDLDLALNSNKALIPALWKNISNLFVRLVDVITPRQYYSGSSSSATSESSRKKKSSFSSDDDDEDGPHSFGSSRY